MDAWIGGGCVNLRGSVSTTDICGPQRCDFAMGVAFHIDTPIPTVQGVTVHR